ncbi:ArsR family transcriptional regulator [Halobacteriales archaeon QS_3_64_16]|nr:MAG: ArsR family transcriptional regulator [Halobacteriales archaeon QS_3_64_16]
MEELDETDMEVLRLLVEDARRPYSEIAAAVSLSPPAVSNRIDRLREAGVIRRFTLDVDRSQLRGGVPVLLTLDVAPTALEDVREALRDAGAVEELFVTADSQLVFHATVPTEDVREWLLATVPMEEVREYDVSLLADADFTPAIGETDFALSCAECGNTVTSEGTATRIDGTRYRFCCPSCETRFEDRYADHADAAG